MDKHKNITTPADEALLEELAASELSHLSQSVSTRSKATNKDQSYATNSEQDSAETADDALYTEDTARKSIAVPSVDVKPELEMPEPGIDHIQIPQPETQAAAPVVEEESAPAEEAKPAMPAAKTPAKIQTPSNGLLDLIVSLGEEDAQQEHIERAQDQVVEAIQEAWEDRPQIVPDLPAKKIPAENTEAKAAAEVVTLLSQITSDKPAAAPAQNKEAKAAAEVAALMSQIAPKKPAKPAANKQANVAAEIAALLSQVSAEKNTDNKPGGAAIADPADDIMSYDQAASIAAEAARAGGAYEEAPNFEQERLDFIINKLNLSKPAATEEQTSAADEDKPQIKLAEDPKPARNFAEELLSQQMAVENMMGDSELAEADSFNPVSEDKPVKLDIHADPTISTPRANTTMLAVEAPQEEESSNKVLSFLFQLIIVTVSSCIAGLLAWWSGLLDWVMNI